MTVLKKKVSENTEKDVFCECSFRWCIGDFLARGVQQIDELYSVHVFNIRIDLGISSLIGKTLDWYFHFVTIILTTIPFSGLYFAR